MSGDSQRKVRRTANEWRRLMAAYEGSGVSQRAFCQHHGLSYSTFSAWRKRLGPAVSGNAGGEPVVELPVVSVGRSQGWRVELELGQGVIVRVR